MIDRVWLDSRNRTTGRGRAEGRWLFQIDSDDMTRVYFRDRDTRCWHTLTWERAASPDMPLSEGAAAPPRRAPTTTNTMGAMMGGLGSNGTQAFSAHLH